MLHTFHQLRSIGQILRRYRAQFDRMKSLRREALDISDRFGIDPARSRQRIRYRSDKTKACDLRQCLRADVARCAVAYAISYKIGRASCRERVEISVVAV